MMGVGDALSSPTPIQKRGRMFFMKKTLSVIFLISLAVLVSSPVFAQSINGQSIFMIDTDLATAGYQGAVAPTGIGAGQMVGFGIYVNKVDALKSFNIDMTWDGTLASMDNDSEVEIEEDDVNINGADITLADDANILVSVSMGPGEIDEDGHYYAAYGKFSGDAVAQEAFGLLYYFVLETSDSFSADDALVVTAKVTIGSGGQEAPRYLGQRYFYVNSGPVDVQESTGGEIKSQFKDF